MSAPADEWDWDFGDGGTSNSRNPAYGYNDTGYFSVTLIAYNYGCGDTITKPLLIHVNAPVARFTFTADCNNRTVFTFTDQSVLPLSWAWDFNDATTSNAQNPVHTFPALGNYNVKLVVTNGGCIDSIIQTVHVINENPNFNSDVQAVCKGTQIPFHATNINLNNVASYFWDFGDGNTATSSSPDILYAYGVTGTYSVMLRITDINGCTNSITKNNYIRVNGPVADFSGNPLRGCVGMTTTFSDQSITDGLNAVTSWKWDFGDGTIQSFNAPPFQHVYNVLDTFSVKLLITDAFGCKDSISKADIIITTDPTPVFASSLRLSCPGMQLTFNNDSYYNIASSFWDFGDGGTSNSMFPAYTYNTPGTYSVKLRITDTNGCMDSLIKVNYITISSPVADFSTSDTASSCAPFEVTFTNSSSYFTNSFWDFGPGEGTSQLTSPVHYFTIPGTYQVKLVITSPGGCKDSTTRTIILYDTLGSRINYLPLTGCNPLAVSLTAFSSGPMDHYIWDFGDGITDTTTSPNINHIYDTYGNFVPRLIMEDPTGCQIPRKGADTLHIIGADARFGQDDSLFCDFGTVNFSDSTTYNDPIANYNWTFGDGNNSSAQNPIHTYNAPGLYTVKLIVTTQRNCTDTMTKTSLIKVVQRPLVDIAGDTTICVRNSIRHLGIFIQPDTSVVTWSWNFPNGATSNAQNPPVQSYSITGTFPVTAIATNSSGCKDTTVQMIHINPLPTVSMPGQMTIQNGFPVTIPATYSPGVFSWTWTPSTGLNCPTCATPDANPKFNTTYSVMFTDNNGCSNSGSIEVIVVCKNMNLFIPNTFSPNGDGSNDIFYPRGKGLDRVKLLRIFNRWGEVVFEKKDFPVNDPSQGWNGTFKGRKPIADVYVYQAEVFCENGELIKINGNIALIL